MTTIELPKPPSLQMIWPRARRTAPAAPPLPDGYSMRTGSVADQDAYIQLMRRAGFEAWDESKAQVVFETMHTQGLFFIIHDATGSLVATAAAQSIAREHHPQGAEMGWVGADPDHRGKRLGYIVCATATRRLLATDHLTLYLLTDDFRLPAIHVYLKMGWLPLLHLPEMAPRWRVVCQGLGILYESLETTTDPAGR